MQDVPYGCCHCGCGQLTNLAAQTMTARGWVKGEPLKYLLGHSGYRHDPQYVVDPITGCWVWQRALDRGGYGEAHARGGKRKRRAHRLYYERYVRPIPRGMQIDHLCRNRACVNPDHLEPVTPAENSRRGRRTLLTHASAFQIRWCRLTTTLTYDDLAEMHGVKKSVVYSVVKGRTWRMTSEAA